MYSVSSRTVEAAPMRGGGLSAEVRTVMAIGMAGLRGRIWSSAEEATVGTREPEKRCREECRMERVCDDRGCEGRCVMGRQAAVRAAILVVMWCTGMFRNQDRDVPRRGRRSLRLQTSSRRTSTIRPLMSPRYHSQFLKQINLTRAQLNRLNSTIHIHLNYPENQVGLEGPKKHNGAWGIWLDGFIDPVIDVANVGGREAFWNAGSKPT